jgi:hypothetical protein
MAAANRIAWPQVRVMLLAVASRSETRIICNLFPPNQVGFSIGITVSPY